jgi:hypothetical protein
MSNLVDESNAFLGDVNSNVSLHNLMCKYCKIIKDYIPEC